MMTLGVNTLQGIPRTSENVGNLARPAAPVDDEVMVDPEISIDRGFTRVYSSRPIFC